MFLVMRYTFSILILFCLVLTSCKDSLTEPDNNITLKVEVKHHSILVPGAKIWLEKSDEFPGTQSDIYSRETIADEWATGSFTELSTGTYWMYAEGYDGADSVAGYNSIFLTDTLLLDIVETELQVSE